MSPIHGFIAAFLAAAAASPHDAPVRLKPALTLDGAKTVAAAAVAHARANGAGGAIAVVDDGGSLLYLERLDGSFAASSRISIGKARTAALFRKPTSVFEKIVNDGRTAMAALDDFTPLQGGVPIEVDGDVVGAIGVSGARSAQQDEDIAVAGAAALRSPAPARLAASVTRLEASAVAKAFAQGAPLVETREFKVHASHRERAGVPEVHASDTDIVYVVSGTATLVTGGTLVGARTTADGEVRGDDIAGGETRAIGSGDVIIIPAGVAHWFKDVPGPIDYYVVKVTRCAGAGS